MMKITITTKQMLHMIEEGYKQGAKDQESNSVSPKNLFAAVESILVAHLRNSE